ncbi:MAG TPA: 50S ribosomal protein L4 [Candidatus Dojkabacteria bacterium]|nr:50S ribosomal protein L4 [Candidatus Dojkabacteria bacterium]
MAEKVKKETKEEVKLNAKVWKAPYNADLVAQVLYVFLSNERKGTSTVKGRGDVSGGGRKPWKQKGTGRARSGSTRSPLWVGGGVTFGPNERNWKRDINKGMVKKAMCVVLSDRNRKNAVKFVSIVSDKELKEIRNILNKEISNKTVVITDSDKVRLALRNIKHINVLTPMRVNVKHIVNSKEVVVDKEAINILETRLLNGK